MAPAHTPMVNGTRRRNSLFESHRGFQSIQQKRRRTKDHYCSFKRISKAKNISARVEMRLDDKWAEANKGEATLQNDDPSMVRKVRGMQGSKEFKKGALRTSPRLSKLRTLEQLLQKQNSTQETKMYWWTRGAPSRIRK